MNIHIGLDEITNFESKIQWCHFVALTSMYGAVNFTRILTIVFTYMKLEVTELNTDITYSVILSLPMDLFPLLKVSKLSFSSPFFFIFLRTPLKKFIGISAKICIWTSVD